MWEKTTEGEAALMFHTSVLLPTPGARWFRYLVCHNGWVTPFHGSVHF